MTTLTEPSEGPESMRASPTFGGSGSSLHALTAQSTTPPDALPQWWVRVWCMTATYNMGPYRCANEEEAIVQARYELRREGNTDMLRWGMNAWEDRD